MLMRKAVLSDQIEQTVAQNPFRASINDDHQEYIGLLGCNQYVVILLRAILVDILDVAERKHPDAVRVY